VFVTELPQQQQQQQQAEHGGGAGQHDDAWILERVKAVNAELARAGDDGSDGEQGGGNISDGAPAVQHDRARRRFTIAYRGDTAFLEYRPVGRAPPPDGRAPALELHRTFTPPAHRGRGFARRLVEAALAHARARGWAVVPSCSYVARYLASEPMRIAVVRWDDSGETDGDGGGGDGVLMLDDGAAVVVSGVPPRRLLEITAATADERGTAWRSACVFATGAGGAVHTGRDAAVAGTYTGVDASGLFWSMVPGGSNPRLYKNNGLAPQRVALTARLLPPTGSDDDGGEGTAAAAAAAAATVERHCVRPGVTRVDVHERLASGRKLVGALFLPAPCCGPGPHPAVLDVSGSAGGLNVTRAALLASRGFAALAIAYFRHGDALPKRMADLPLEYFADALAWLRAHPRTLGDRAPAVVGSSKGAEAALLTAAHFPHAVGAVVTGSPSCVHSGVAGPAFTLGGDGLPCILWDHAVLGRQVQRHQARIQKDGGGEGQQAAAPLVIELRDALLRALELAPGDPALIPVGRLACDALLVCGVDDRNWPSLPMARRMQAAAPARGGGDAAMEVLAFAAAGHQCYMPPGLPTTLRQDYNKTSGGWIAFGGTARGNAAAQRAQWRRTLGFLRAYAARSPEGLPAPAARL